MASGNTEPTESEAEMGTAVMGAWTGGRGTADIGDVRYHVSSGGNFIRVGDVGHVPAYWEESGMISPSSGADTYRANTTAESV